MQALVELFPRYAISVSDPVLVLSYYSVAIPNMKVGLTYHVLVRPPYHILVWYQYGRYMLVLTGNGKPWLFISKLLVSSWCFYSFIYVIACLWTMMLNYVKYKAMNITKKKKKKKNGFKIQMHLCELWNIKFQDMMKRSSMNNVKLLTAQWKLTSKEKWLFTQYKW